MKIALLLSGGVDSSVALTLLKNAGHDVTAFYLKIWLEDELAYLGECPWEEDLAYAREICERFEIPLEVIPMQKAYWEKVVQYTLDEVGKGRTPNPDMLCNQQIKFGVFYEKRGEDFDKIATGHYARIEEVDGVFHLKKAADAFKDQTYFLSYLSQNQLSRALFPIGDYTKDQIRDMAEQSDLPNKARKDSQGICFLGKFKFADFLRHHLGEKPGDLIEYETGKKVGEHPGFWYFTIGQRQGIGLGNGPWFVVKKDTEKNQIYISKNYHSTEKSRDMFDVEDFNWIAGYRPPVGQTVPLEVKIRHGEELYAANVQFLSENRARIMLPESDQGIAEGQFTAFYDGDECLGGAVISVSAVD